MPEEWVAIIQKAGFTTIELLKEANPNKLHQTICGLNKKHKLGLKNPVPDDVKSWVAE